MAMAAAIENRAAEALAWSRASRIASKRLFCKSDEPIFDSFIPLSLRGKVAASAMSAINRAKRRVKHNQMLFSLFHMAQTLRSALHR